MSIENPINSFSKTDHQKKYSRRDFIMMVGGVFGGVLLQETPEATPTTHIVRLGETLFTIAQQYGLTLQEILQINPQILDYYFIEVGQEIIITKPQIKPVLIKKITPTLEVKEETKVIKPIYWGNRSVPEVALTFDDGHSRKSIETVLEVLKKYNLTCTFFIVGERLITFSNLWQQAVEDGHQICNHSYSHAYLSNLSSEGIKKEVEKWEQAAKEVLGREYFDRMRNNFSYIRFPGGEGHKSPKVLNSVAKMGYLPIAWSAETCYAILRNHDYQNEDAGPIAEEIRQYVISKSQNGAIILLHFNVWDVARLEEIIAGIQEKKLDIKTVTGVLD